MITVRAKACGGIVVTSKMLLDNERVSEFENHNNVVENMAKDAGFMHMLEKDCQGVFTSISQTFNKAVTMDELEEFEKRHQEWLKNIKRTIESEKAKFIQAEEMATQQERERECPCHEVTCDDDDSIQEKDIEFLKRLQKNLNELDEDGDEITFTAQVRIAGMFPIAVIGNRLLKILIKDATEKYVS